ncbi:MAG: DUF2508 family protein [Firmicutes bacterium]|nr:DUF2508 family protein [Bacillota bacterium]
MPGWFAGWLRRCCTRLREGSGSKRLDDEKILAEAHRDWMAARKFFEFATEPDLVDYAILTLQAAEKRYVYLWKKMRQKG